MNSAMKIFITIHILLCLNAVFGFKTYLGSKIRLKTSQMTPSHHESVSTQSITSTIKSGAIMSSLLVSTLLGSPDCSFAVGTSPLEVVTHNSMTTVSPLWISGEEMMSPQASKVNKFIRLPSGVEYYDAIVGEGADTVKEGTSVQFQWVLRRSNGYFVDASSNYDNEPFIYKVGNTKKVIKGIDEAIRGMKVGGVRRINVPPAYAFVEGVGDGKPGPMPAGFGPRRQIETRLDREVWYFEIKVTKLRN